MTICTDYKFSPYFVIVLLSFAMSYLFIFSYARKQSINKKHVLYSMLLHFVISIYCGFMFTFIANVANGEGAFAKVGLSGMGGMAGTIISIIIMSFLFKGPKNIYIRCYVMALPLIYGVSKLGCFLVGCCYGMPYDGVLSVKYIKDGVMTPDHSVFPVQLVECILFIALAIFFYWLISRNDNRIIVFIEIVSCCVLKFLLDWLRNRADMQLSVNQIACVLVSLGVMIYMVIQKIKKWICD